LRRTSRGAAKSTTPSRATFHAIINAGRDARNVIITKQQEREEVEA
jgi:hypothetical protein